MEPTAREPTREGRWATPVAGQARHSSALGRMSSSGLAEARSRLRHTFFIAVPPSGRVVKSYVDTLTLLSTFMFAFSAIHVTAVPRRDLASADASWLQFCTELRNSTLQDGLFQSLCQPFTPPSIQLATYVTITYVVLGGAVLVSAMSYFATIFAEIDEETRPADLVGFWSWYQWPMHLGVVLLAGGFVCYGLTMEMSARIVFIDTHLRAKAEDFVFREVNAFNAVFVVVGLVFVYMIVAHVVLSTRDGRKRQARNRPLAGEDGGDRAVELTLNDSATAT